MNNQNVNASRRMKGDNHRSNPGPGSSKLRRLIRERGAAPREKFVSGVVSSYLHCTATLRINDATRDDALPGVIP
jgi:hypothetical protein